LASDNDPIQEVTMKNQDGFARHLKRGKRSPGAIKQCIAYAGEFERFLRERGRELDEATPDDLVAFVEQVESKPKASAKKHLWALRYYFEHTANDPMCRLAGALRQERIARKPFPLAKFRGVDLEHAARLEGAGIRDVDHMLRAGRTPGDRQALAERTGVPLDVILEFVKLSDLSRVGATKAVRARLYYDAGIDTPTKIAQFEPEDLRATLIEFVARTGFDGIAPLPKEAKHAVAAARSLDQIVEYESVPLDEEKES
jgi:hypothetical protein